MTSEEERSMYESAFHEGGAEWAHCYIAARRWVRSEYKPPGSYDPGEFERRVRRLAELLQRQRAGLADIHGQNLRGDERKRVGEALKLWLDATPLRTIDCVAPNEYEFGLLADFVASQRFAAIRLARAACEALYEAKGGEFAAGVEACEHAIMALIFQVRQ